jgi:hypothetical protein
MWALSRHFVRDSLHHLVVHAVRWKTWVTAGTTSNIWTASLQAGHVKVYPLDVHTKIPYEFVATFTHPQTTYEYETACDLNCYPFRLISLGRGSCYRFLCGQTWNT